MTLDETKLRSLAITHRDHRIRKVADLILRTGVDDVELLCERLVEEAEDRRGWSW